MQVRIEKLYLFIFLWEFLTRKAKFTNFYFSGGDGYDKIVCTSYENKRRKGDPTVYIKINQKGMYHYGKETAESAAGN